MNGKKKMQESRWVPAVEELGALTNFVGVLPSSDCYR